MRGPKIRPDFEYQRYKKKTNKIIIKAENFYLEKTN